jgi:protein-S-isoprenylcysteine O-methyltransferase Ste14
VNNGIIENSLTKCINLNRKWCLVRSTPSNLDHKQNPEELMQAESPTSKKQTSVIVGIFARAGQILFMFVFLGLILFLGSGNIRWRAAWVYLGISLLSVAINAIFMLHTSPETVAERGQAKGWQDWDKLISGLWAGVQYLILSILAALDARFHWSGEIGIFWHGVGALVYALSLALSGWAMITNAYFSTAARIQSDRGQQVCRTGPYRYVRHPGYVAFVIQSLGMAILLGSLWALLPALAAGALMVTRTAFEDRMLQKELPGYKEYTSEVKFRLLPGVW